MLETHNSSPSISADLKAVHGGLSRTGVEFLDFVESHPELLERATFATLPEMQSRVGYPVPAWPTFIRSDLLSQLGRLNVDLCRLVKKVPHQVFQGDPEKLQRFYSLEYEHARLVAASLGNAPWIKGLLGRSDFYRASSGFKCMEFNMVANLGGWSCSYWGPEYLRDPALAPFVTNSASQPKSANVLRNLLAHLLRQGLSKFRTSELNIALLFPAETDKSAGNLVTTASELYGKMLAALGSVSGRIIRCESEMLREHQGHLYAGEDRIHVLLDAVAGSAGLDAHKCWLRGTLLLYNGPVAPVLSDKRNLALLSELADADLWTDEEKATIRSAVPWSRRVSELAVHPQAEASVTPEFLRAERQHLVLKPGSGYGGQDIYLGHITPADEWAAAVDRAFADGHWVAQELLDSLPLAQQIDGAGYAPYNVVWGFFVFGETFGGVDLRMSPASGEGPVNSSCGALSGWLFEVDEND